VQRFGGRRFDYDRGLLPHPYLAELEADEFDADFVELSKTPPRDDAERKERAAARTKWLGDTHMSPGYPAWNLLYYTVLSSIDPELEDVVVLETGANCGVSTIVMAQAVRDLGLDVPVHTVELHPGLAENAQRNIEKAGLSDYVRFTVGNSLDFLEKLTAEVDHIDFAFIDDLHTRDHILREIDLVCPKVFPRRGKVFFDNTGGGGDVALALRELRPRFGGNLVEFANCSWGPPGNVIWQPD
jgi:predicted O-methyltransferase YrrM